MKPPVDSGRTLRRINPILQSIACRPPKIYRKNQEILQQIAGHARSLWRESHHSEGIRPVLGFGNGSNEAVFDFSSTITDTRYFFDEHIVSSAAYRRALINLRRTGRGTVNNVEPADLADRIEKTPATMAGSAKSTAVLPWVTQSLRSNSNHVRNMLGTQHHHNHQSTRLRQKLS